MRKQIVGLLTAGLLVSGLSVVPMSVSAASANDNPSIHSSWMDWLSSWDNDNANTVNAPNNDASNDNTDQSNTEQPAGHSSNVSEDAGKASDEIEKVIADGMKYLGTPYEFGSDRSTSTTFDCSDFIRWIFKETLVITLPSDSRKQGAYVKENNPNTVQTDWSKLKRGDLMFFMSYEGSNETSYKNVNKETERITHVGIYLGNGKILHTYSKESGGVTTSTIGDNQWEYRFLYGGSAV